ncbi:MAG: transposase, partial [Actinomycetota bacterium]|nr:transposase [Actinomycetota bacterium]
IALSLVDLSGEWGVSFDVVVADSGYGKYPKFLEGLEERKLPYYVCGVESTFGVRLPEEVRALLRRLEHRRHTGEEGGLPRNGRLLFTRPRK